LYCDGDTYEVWLVIAKLESNYYQYVIPRVFTCFFLLQLKVLTLTVPKATDSDNEKFSKMLINFLIDGLEQN